MIDTDRSLMRKAFNLAQKATNYVFPNPFVGALVVKKNKIIGRGYHLCSGENHAEVNALNDAGCQAKGANLYVTLEPCSTYGKTPPCTDAIIKSGVKKVFFGAYDLNPENHNKAVNVLNHNKIETEFIDYQTKHDELNNIFNHNLRSRFPYVILKSAISLDGKISDSFNHSKWISCSKSRLKVHEIRGKCDAIMIGANTFNQDNPRLNIRLDNKKLYKDPAKVIISAKADLNFKNNLLKQTTESEVIIFTIKDNEKKIAANVLNKNCIIKSFDNKFEISLKRCLTYLKKRRYYSVLVEGGSILIEKFLKTSLFNELNIFIAPKIFGDKGKTFSNNADIHKVRGTKQLELESFEQIENDIYLRYKNVYRYY